MDIGPVRCALDSSYYRISRADQGWSSCSNSNNIFKTVMTDSKQLYQRRHVLFLLGNMARVETVRVILLTDRCLQATCNGLTLMFNTELCDALECVWPLRRCCQDISLHPTHTYTIYRPEGQAKHKHTQLSISIQCMLLHSVDGTFHVSLRITCRFRNLTTLIFHDQANIMWSNYVNNEAIFKGLSFRHYVSVKI